MSMRGTSTLLQQPPPKVSNHAGERCSARGCQPESKQTRSLLLKINKPIREKACYSSVGGIFARWKIINAFLFPRGEAAKVLSRIKSRRRRTRERNYSSEIINNEAKLATSGVINRRRLGGEGRAQRGKIRCSFFAPRSQGYMPFLCG